MTRREIVAWLAQHRRTRKISQDSIGTQLSGTRWGANTIYRWEKGVVDPALSAVIAWADCLGAEIIVREKVHEQSVEESPVEPRR